MWKHQFQFAGYYAALDQGFYQDEGLDVELLEFSNDRDLAKMVVNGEAEFAVGRSSILVDYLQGKPITALFAAFQRSPLMLLTRDDSGISHVKDLRDKRIMITSDAEQNAEVMAMMLQAGIKPGEYLHQDHSFNLQDLIDRNTDAMGAYISNEPYQMIKQGIGYNIIHPGTKGFEMYSDILFTSNLLLEQKPELVERFRRASIKGWQYAFNNIQATANLIYSNYNTQNRSLEALFFEGQSLKELAYVDGIEFGSLSSERFSAMVPIYKLLSPDLPDYDISEFIYQPAWNKLPLLLTRSERDFLKSNTEVTFCADPDWLPYSGIADNELIGIDSEYVQYLSEQTGIVFKLVLTESWQESIDASRLGRCRVLFTGINTAERREYLSYTAPYRHVSLSLATRRVFSKIEGFSQLEGFRVGVLKGDAYATYLVQNYPQLELVSFEHIVKGVEQVAQGEVDVMLGPYATLNYTFKELNLTDLIIQGPLIEQWSLAIGVRKEDVLLTGILNRLLLRLGSEDHLRFAARWMAYQPQTIKVATYLWPAILMLVLGLLLLMVYFAWLSKHRYKPLSHYVLEQGFVYSTDKVLSYLENVVSCAGNRPVSVIVMEIENERTSDRLGSTADSLEALFLNLLQFDDVVGQWAGDQFVIVLPDTDLSRAMLLARRLQSSLIELNRKDKTLLKCSIGVSCERGVSGPLIIEQAEEALQDAIQAGGHCIMQRSYSA
ncbi:ABC transporter substrate-binding protein [Amphritea balenae]|nr:ABC transporter substrate-binding protein [Amphritea balenae]GGK57362.1 hypothetical protein GCM10007941_04380 [Amphritea balenae]